MFGWCYLCEEAESPPVAVCSRCGAFVCREHSVRLVHHPRRMPSGGFMTLGERQQSRRLEIICEACHLNQLVTIEFAPRRSV